MLTPTLRPAREGDRQAVVALLRSEGLEDAFVPTQFVVADEGDRIVGCARLKPLAGGGGELASVAVVPERRGRGLGRALVEALVAEVEVQGPVVGLAVSPGFFAHLGARTLGDVPAELREKAEEGCEGQAFVPMAWEPHPEASGEP